MGMGSGSRKSDIGKAGDMKQTVNRPSARAALSYIPDDRKEALSLLGYEEDSVGR